MCMYVYVYVSVYVYVYVCMCMCMYVCVCVCACYRKVCKLDTRTSVVAAMNAKVPALRSFFKSSFLFSSIAVLPRTAFFYFSFFVDFSLDIAQKFKSLFLSLFSNIPSEDLVLYFSLTLLAGNPMFPLFYFLYLV
jgi:hypothetical protein